MLLSIAIQAFLLVSFTSASPHPQANPAASNPCPYSLFATITIQSGRAYPQITWIPAPSNTVVYPLSFAAGATPAPSPTNCMIVQGAPYCLIVAADVMAKSLWSSLGTRTVASEVCPTPPWNTAGVTAAGVPPAEGKSLF
jgi:hypothetical protein